MSKSNGNGHLPTPDELRALVVEGLKLTRKLPAQPWTADGTGTIRAEKTFRRFGDREFNDVCKVNGGGPSRAATAEWMAWVGNNFHTILLSVRRLQKVTPDDRYQPEMGECKPDAASDRLVGFLELVAEAFEVLGFKENNLGHHAGDRIIGSDRQEKAELLRRLADFIDPVNDEARLRKLHHQERVPANGLPTNEDLRKMFTNEDLRSVLPPSLCRVLDDEKYFDEELDRAQLESTAQRRWELPSHAIRLYVRSRLAGFDTWGHFKNYRVPNPTPEQSLEGLEGAELSKAITRNLLRPHRDIHEYYAKEMEEMVFDLANDPDWLRRNRDTEDAIFNKIMSGESTGVEAYHDMTWVVNNWDFPERPL